MTLWGRQESAIYRWHWGLEELSIFPESIWVTCAGPRPRASSLTPSSWLFHSSLGSLIRSCIGLSWIRARLVKEETFHQVSPHYLLWPFWSPNMWRFFPTPSDSVVSYNLTQSWHCLPGDSSLSLRLRAPSCKPAPLPTSDATHKFRLSPVLLTNWL